MSESRFPPLTRMPGTDLEPTLSQADLILTHDPCSYTFVQTRSYPQVPFQVGVNWEGTPFSPLHLGLEPGLHGSCLPALPRVTGPRSWLYGSALWLTFPFPSKSGSHTTQRNTSRCLPLLCSGDRIAQEAFTCAKLGGGGTGRGGPLVTAGPETPRSPAVQLRSAVRAGPQNAASSPRSLPHPPQLLPAIPDTCSPLPRITLRKLRWRPHSFGNQGVRVGAAAIDGHPERSWAHLGKARSSTPAVT